nr:lipase secretion chaperone [uncultured Steroidobacter sp.]
MRTRPLVVICLMVAVGIAVIWWVRTNGPQPVASRAADEPAATTQAAVKPNEEIDATEPSRPITPAPAPDSPPARTDGVHPFRVDGTGKLVMDEQTRLNMEALFAHTDAADLSQAQQNATATLPPAAATEAAALLQQYDNYSKAQRQSYPPGNAPATEEAALAELDGLHALRVAHFGPEVAKALYGAEEDLTRSLIELMRLEKDQSLTLQEKAERAQRLHDEIEARQQGRR